MKVLKWILIVLGVIIVAYLAFSATQPNQLKVEKSVTIEAPSSKVWSVIIDYPNWDQWAVWNQIDSNMENTYSETFGEVGSFTQWTSDHPQVGNGRQEIVEVVKNEKLKAAMQFGESKDKHYATFTLTEENGQTTVVWNMLGAETPFYANAMNTFMKPLIEDSYTKSLNQLKTYVEEMPDDNMGNDMGIEVTTVEPMAVITIADTVPADSISAMLERSYGEMMGYIASAKGVEMSGMPMAIYHSFSPEKVVMEAAIPYSGQAKVSGNMIAKEIPGGKVVRAVHYGDYNTSGQTHEAMESFLTSNDLTYSGPCWEVYANDPAKVDSADIETHIYYPIK